MIFHRNIIQHGDALTLLRSLPPGCSPLVHFDPQHRGVLDKLAFGNEGARQRERCRLPAMGEDYIDACCREIARVLKPSGYCMRWADTFGLCEAHHLRIADCLKCVDLIAWDNLRLGMGKRSRRRGDYLLVLQRPPVTARNWRDHGIPSRWVEKVDRRIHPHAKPIGLIKRLIAAVTLPGDLIVDPAAGSFTALHAVQQLGRDFIGCDIAYEAPMTNERIFVAGFVDNEVTRVAIATAWPDPDEVDLYRGLKLSQAAYRARRKCKTTPQIVAAYFENSVGGRLHISQAELNEMME
jgi:site-specific DNA-methyltransferase (adenine-specific)